MPLHVRLVHYANASTSKYKVERGEILMVDIHLSYNADDADLQRYCSFGEHWQLWQDTTLIINELEFKHVRNLLNSWTCGVFAPLLLQALAPLVWTDFRHGCQAILYFRILTAYTLSNGLVSSNEWFRANLTSHTNITRKQCLLSGDQKQLFLAYVMISEVQT